MKFKICISYDGSDTNGWQGVGKRNQHLKTILEDAIFNFSKIKVDLICAARTDSGVHAEMNYCSFKLNTLLSEYKIKHAMNYFLPKKIRVLSVEKVPENFDARFSAVLRHYRYLVANGTTTPLLHERVWFPRIVLKKIFKLTDLIKGLHNFNSFCPSKTIGKKIKTITDCYIEEIDILGTKVYIINLLAKSFLHHQVRNIVGCFIDFEKNHLSLSQITKSLENGDKIPINMAPAFALYLHKVIY